MIFEDYAGEGTNGILYTSNQGHSLSGCLHTITGH